MSLQVDIRWRAGDFRLEAAFDAPARGTTVLFGPSGSGKTSLLRAIAGLERVAGRVVLGVAAGYLREEFQALGADFERRNEAADDAIVAMRKVWSGETVEHEGVGYAARGHQALPRPRQRPGPPIWVGGNSRRAIERAALLGDGWLPFPTAGIAGRVRTAEIASLADLEARL